MCGNIDQRYTIHVRPTGIIDFDPCRCSMDNQGPKNIKELSQTKRFLCMQIEEVAQLLRDPNVKIESELDKIRALVSWLEFNMFTRYECLPCVLKLMKLRCISPALISKIQMEYPHVFCSPLGKQAICDAFRYHALRNTPGNEEEEADCGSEGEYKKQKNVKDLCKMTDFLCMDVDGIKNLLEDPNVIIESELDKIRALVCWLQFNMARRYECIPRLMSFVKWRDVGPAAIALLECEFPHVFCTPHGKNVISCAFRFHALDEFPEEKDTNGQQESKSTDKKEKGKSNARKSDGQTQTEKRKKQKKDR